MKKKIVAVALIGLLAAVGLFLAGCGPNCSGSGDCTVTIDQGGSGLYIDGNAARSTCGESATYSYDTGSYTGGCEVQNNINGIHRKYGKHGCDC